MKHNEQQNAKVWWNNKEQKRYLVFDLRQNKRMWWSIIKSNKPQGAHKNNETQEQWSIGMWRQEQQRTGNMGHKKCKTQECLNFKT
jgi:hypothetical protein